MRKDLAYTPMITHMQDLQEVTQEVHYENYRSERLAKSVRKNTNPISSKDDGGGGAMNGATEAAFTEKDRILREKEEEIRRMQEKLAQMQAKIQAQK
ncbi:conserved hypothetical protein [Culex quinquefasciatus]|uniref:Septin-type G domain-containing protein n=1 Tax=Culex quinquefasciatus TaxID=7176 RepID=B0WQM5_CULQU|nr:conserved hypothetical protein [Culex quinquefasciatus]|eukprot:XP_001851009.1 conserved hypothetical protein [Culex quinquefasciatus]